MHHLLRPSLAGGLALALVACSSRAGDQSPPADAGAGNAGQALVVDTTSQPNVVRVAAGSRDHTTLVAALKAANLVDPLANVGPFTVFAPTNAAFDKLPAGTLDNLLKPESKSALVNVLYHHVTTSALDLAQFEDGRTLNMVDGTPVTINRRGGDIFVNDAKVLGSVRASNGWVYVIDGVLVPKAK